MYKNRFLLAFPYSLRTTPNTHRNRNRVRVLFCSNTIFVVGIKCAARPRSGQTVFNNNMRCNDDRLLQPTF